MMFSVMMSCRVLDAITASRQHCSRLAGRILVGGDVRNGEVSHGDVVSQELQPDVKVTITTPRVASDGGDSRLVVDPQRDAHG